MSYTLCRPAICLAQHFFRQALVPPYTGIQSNTIRFSTDSTDELESALKNIKLDDVNNNDGKKKKKEKKPGAILNDTTVESVVEYIRSGKCRKIVIMVGAGISTCMFILLSFGASFSELFDYFSFSCWYSRFSIPRHWVI